MRSFNASSRGLKFVSRPPRVRCVKKKTQDRTSKRGLRLVSCSTKSALSRKTERSFRGKRRTLESSTGRKKAIIGVGRRAIVKRSITIAYVRSAGNNRVNFYRDSERLITSAFNRIRQVYESRFVTRAPVRGPAFLIGSRTRIVRTVS